MRVINEAIEALIDAGAPEDALRILEAWRADKIAAAIREQGPGVDLDALYAGISERSYRRAENPPRALRGRL